MDIVVRFGTVDADETWVVDLLHELVGAEWLTPVEGPSCDVLVVMVTRSDLVAAGRSLQPWLLAHLYDAESVFCVAAPGAGAELDAVLSTFAGRRLLSVVEPSELLAALHLMIDTGRADDEPTVEGIDSDPGHPQDEYELDAVDLGFTFEKALPEAPDVHSPIWPVNEETPAEPDPERSASRKSEPQPLPPPSGAPQPPPQVPLDAPPPIETDLFEASVFTPAVVEPGVPFLLQLWAYLADEWDDVERRASKGGSRVEAGSEGSLEAARGSRITALLQIPSMHAEQQKVFVWNGRMTSVGFTVGPPDGCRLGTHVGTITLLIAGAPIGVVSFDVTVGPTAEESERAAPTQLRMLRNAFASYSSQDRPAVLARVQALRAAGIRVFIDVVDLLDGRWRDALERAIGDSDVLYLFWSRAAAQSAEVEREWRLGLERRGIDFISPLPLESPEKAPPPPELHELQFGSIYLRLQESLSRED